jgi:hypothetical protein
MFFIFKDVLHRIEPRDGVRTPTTNIHSHPINLISHNASILKSFCLATAQESSTHYGCSRARNKAG